MRASTANRQYFPKRWRMRLQGRAKGPAEQTSHLRSDVSQLFDVQRGMVGDPLTPWPRAAGAATLVKDR